MRRRVRTGPAGVIAALLVLESLLWAWEIDKEYAAYVADDRGVPGVVHLEQCGYEDSDVLRCFGRFTSDDATLTIEHATVDVSWLDDDMTAPARAWATGRPDGYVYSPLVVGKAEYVIEDILPRSLFGLVLVSIAMVALGLEKQPEEDPEDWFDDGWPHDEDADCSDAPDLADRADPRRRRPRGPVRLRSRRHLPAGELRHQRRRRGGR